MSGLMERKKENRKKRIHQSALKLFEELGFEKTTMEKIAADAELGVGTLYNYYPSKVILLFSIIEAGVGKYTTELDQVIDKSVYLSEAVFEFYQIYFKSFSTYGKRVWSEIFRETLFRQSNLEKMIDNIDKQFIVKLKELMFIFRERGMLKESVDIETTVSVLYALLGYNIIRYVSENEMTEMELAKLLKSQAGMVINSLTR